MNKIYLDYAATTPVRKEVLTEMLPFFSEEFGNPGSMHSLGLNAKKVLFDSRLRISKILNSNLDEIIFTGSGTESVNLAIKGSAFALKNKGNHIISSKIEHHSVLHSLEYLEDNFDFKISLIDVDKKGIIDVDSFEKEFTKKTILASVMYANNEIGSIQPIKKLAEIAHKNNSLFHSDACQASGFLDIDVKNLGVDFFTLNGSKVYAPKGVGLLFAKKGLNFHPIIHGGQQEFSKRAGTENIPSIVGLTKALELATVEKETEIKRLSFLRDKLINGILEKVPDTFLNGHDKKRLPNNVNITFINVEGESLILYLNEKGIMVSTGSACSTSSLEPSHVIRAIGLPFEAAHGSIRFSLGKYTTEKDIDFVIKVLPEIVEKLRNISSAHLTKKEVLGNTTE